MNRDGRREQARAGAPLEKLPGQLGQTSGESRDAAFHAGCVPRDSSQVLSRAKLQFLPGAAIVVKRCVRPCGTSPPLLPNLPTSELRNTYTETKKKEKRLLGNGCCNATASVNTARFPNEYDKAPPKRRRDNTVFKIARSAQRFEPALGSKRRSHILVHFSFQLR